MTDQNNNLPVEKDMASQGLVDKMKGDSLAFFNPTAWDGINLMAKTFFNSGAMPRSLDSAPKVIMALQAGKEAGMQPMEALQAFAPINGKMTMYGDSVISQVAKAGHIITWGKCDKGSATVTIERGDNGQKMTETYTVADAKEAGIFKNVWCNHPRRMVKYKAFAEVAHFLVPDALKGVITRELADEYAGDVVIENKKEYLGIGTAEVMQKEEQKTQAPSLNEALDKEPEIEDMPEEAPKRLKADVIKDITFSAGEKNITTIEICAKYKKKTLNSFTVPELLTIEEALEKSPIKEGKAAKPKGEAIDTSETPAAKAVRRGMAKQKLERGGGTWDAETCEYLKFIDGIPDEELPADILQLKKDAVTGVFMGYEEYPSLKAQIASMKGNNN